MKTTKTQLRSAIDSFIYTYSDLTGGTSAECCRQSTHGLASLSALAEKCAQLAANPNKAAAADAHLMEYATERITSKLAHYVATYCEPSNVIQFPRVA
jgi:hypothetical protein